MKSDEFALSDGLYKKFYSEEKIKLNQVDKRSLSLLLAVLSTGNDAKELLVDFGVTLGKILILSICPISLLKMLKQAILYKIMVDI